MDDNERQAYAKSLINHEQFSKQFLFNENVFANIN